jgi:regulator of sigma E protease
METFLIRALQLIFSLSILVVLHELGHFAFARLFKVRVEKFYMFFNPNFSLIRAKKVNGNWDVKFFSSNVPANERPKLNGNGDEILDAKGKTVMEKIPESELPENDWRKYPESTEWGIGWLPLGGYCSISGMVDETKDITQLASEPQPWEYRSRSVWQRLPIIIGGVLVNFILAMILFSAVLFTWGEDYIPLKNAKYGLQFSPLMIENGFLNGDNIASVDGKPVEDVHDAVKTIMFDNAKTVTVLRDSKTLDISLPDKLTLKAIGREETNIISIRFPFVIDSVMAGSPAAVAKLQAGDSITGINGKPLFIYQDIATELDASRSTRIELSFVRKGQHMKTGLQLDEKAKLGVAMRPNIDFLTPKHISYGFLASMPAGIKLGWESLSNNVKGLKYAFTKEGSKQVGGFGSIGKMFPTQWNWQIFWSMTALLSIILAFMNFLPIPALDGGYVLFLVYEIITGKKPSDKFLEYAQTVGFFLLMGLLLFANGNDLFKAIFK